VTECVARGGTAKRKMKEVEANRKAIYKSDTAYIVRRLQGEVHLILSDKSKDLTFIFYSLGIYVCLTTVIITLSFSPSPILSLDAPMKKSSSVLNRFKFLLFVQTPTLHYNSGVQQYCIRQSR